MISQKYHHEVKRNKQFHDSYYVLPNVFPDSWAPSVVPESVGKGRWDIGSLLHAELDKTVVPD